MSLRQRSISFCIDIQGAVDAVAHDARFGVQTSIIKRIEQAVSYVGTDANHMVVLAIHPSVNGSVPPPLASSIVGVVFSSDIASITATCGSDKQLTGRVVRMYDVERMSIQENLQPKQEQGVVHGFASHGKRVYGHTFSLQLLVEWSACTVEKQKADTVTPLTQQRQQVNHEPLSATSTERCYDMQNVHLFQEDIRARGSERG